VAAVAVNRVVVLGASNVSRGLARLVAAVRTRSPRPAHLFVAAGHGRSYGANSRVGMRRLPSILWCGLWRALDREAVAASGPLRAVITDVGNDLLYGFSVEQTAAWVRQAAGRLAAHDATLAITRLPLEGIASVGTVRYRLLRTLYVPGCPLSLDQLQDAAARLDTALVAIAREFGSTIIEQPGAWYGLDAIHVRRRSLDALWSEVCDAWELPSGAARPRATLNDWAAVGRRAAEVRMLAGRMRFTRQPVIDRDRLRLSLY